MKKKLAILLASLSLCAFTFTACGGDDNDDSGTQEENQETAKLEKGTKCSNTDECKPNLVCREESAGGDKKCLDPESNSETSKLEKGTKCSNTDECKPNLVCREESAGGDKKCLDPETQSTEKPGKNQKCSTDPGCEGSLICEASTDGNSYCRVAEGNLCVETEDCVKDHECREESAGGDKKCFKPLIENNNPCTTHEECKSKFCKKGSGNNSACAAKIAAETQCEDGDLCVDGYTCKQVGADFKCTQKLSDGTACTNHEECLSGFCKDGTPNKTCSAKLGNGSKCTANDICEDTLECRKENASANETKCLIKLIGLGQECTDNCKTDLVCEADAQGSKKHCKADAGKACTSNDDCIKNYECTGSAGSKICTKILAGKGEECLADEDCKTAYCRKATDATAATKGKCDLFPKDHTCSSNDECKSGKCNPGQCSQDQTCVESKCAQDECSGACEADETCAHAGLCIKDININKVANDDCTSADFVNFCRKSDDTASSAQYLVRCDNNKIVVDDCSVTDGRMTPIAKYCATGHRVGGNDTTTLFAYCPTGNNQATSHCTNVSLGNNEDTPFTACYGQDKIAKGIVCMGLESTYLGMPTTIEACPAGTKCQQSYISLGAECK